MKSFFTSFFLLTVTVFCHAQKKWSVQEVITKAEQHYATAKQYSYDLDYCFYKNGFSSAIVDRYSGLLIKKDGVIYQKVNAAQSVNFSDCLVTLNPVDKVLFVSKKGNKTPPVVLKQFLKMSKGTKLTGTKEHWICELTAGKEQRKEFTKIVIYVNKKDFSLNRQIFYTEGAQEIEKENKLILLKNPRLEILYSANSKAMAKYAPVLSKSYYFSTKNNKIIPSKRFQKYKLITQ